jgi:hypothetical protein
MVLLSVPHQSDLPEVADPGREQLPDQIEKGEVDQSDAVGVGLVLKEGKVGSVAQ